jgi:hypothetical protein
MVPTIAADQDFVNGEDRKWLEFLCQSKSSTYKSLPTAFASMWQQQGPAEIRRALEA